MVADTFIMPFGKHKGEKIVNVPAEYLLFMFESNKLFGTTKQYVSENLDVLRKEKKSDKSWKTRIT